MQESRKWQMAMWIKGRIAMFLHMVSAAFLALGKLEEMIVAFTIACVIDAFGLEFYLRFHKSVISEVVKK